ncbi:hypothetical protein SAMN06298216_2929 [Spirosomataceae bacterium TFI 002]|nr:hypothetical protein SAMN06298216_2929 [Spirosomataceae bacterium TFI 002]
MTKRVTPLWWIKLTKFEYWNWMAFYGPIIPVWLYLAVKARSITFFTAVNPACSAGGFLNENKMQVLNLLPKEVVPFSKLISKGQTTFPELTFPVVAKPNSGQRGRGIEKLLSLEDLKRYHAGIDEDYVLQEFIESPIELAVFYSRMPNEAKGKISSITSKEFMTVIGDGVSTIEQLMEQNDRYRFQLKSTNLAVRSLILMEGEVRVLEPIGNHCRGTKFVDQRSITTPELEQVFDDLMKNVKGFFYGRFDLKVESLSSLQLGKGIKVMELNGVNGDPGHIFDPNYKLLSAYKDVYWHWNRMAQIAAFNIKNGIKPLPVSTVWSTIVNKFKP